MKNGLEALISNKFFKYTLAALAIATNCFAIGMVLGGDDNGYVYIGTTIFLTAIYFGSRALLSHLNEKSGKIREIRTALFKEIAELSVHLTELKEVQERTRNEFKDLHHMIHKSDSQAIMICSLLSREIENRIDVIQAISTSTSLEILKNGLADCALSFQPEEDCHSTLVFGVKQTHAVPRPELHLTVLKLSSQLSAAIARKPSSSRAA